MKTITEQSECDTRNATTTVQKTCAILYSDGQLSLKVLRSSVRTRRADM